MPCIVPGAVITRFILGQTRNPADNFLLSVKFAANLEIRGFPSTSISANIDKEKNPEPLRIRGERGRDRQTDENST